MLTLTITWEYFRLEPLQEKQNIIQSNNHKNQTQLLARNKKFNPPIFKHPWIEFGI